MRNEYSMSDVGMPAIQPLLRKPCHAEENCFLPFAALHLLPAAPPPPQPAAALSRSQAKNPLNSRIVPSCGLTAPAKTVNSRPLSALGADGRISGQAGLQPHARQLEADGKTIDLGQIAHDDALVRSRLHGSREEIPQPSWCGQVHHGSG